jgi:hypothetical protein
MAKMTSLLVFGVLTAPILAADLSRYRDLELGAGLPDVVKQTEMDPSQAKMIHHRPALIQELKWRPQALNSSSQAEAVQEVVLSFYNGKLFRIVVNYDQYEIKGLTASDIVEAVSIPYGTPAAPAPAAKAMPGRYSEEEVLARWEDSQYRFELIRSSSYRLPFKLIGVFKKLEEPARAAVVEAMRLDDNEAPQREAEALARKDETERAQLEKARNTNKPKFRP